MYIYIFVFMYIALMIEAPYTGPKVKPLQYRTSGPRCPASGRAPTRHSFSRFDMPLHEHVAQGRPGVPKAGPPQSQRHDNSNKTNNKALRGHTQGLRAWVSGVGCRETRQRPGEE